MPSNLEHKARRKRQTRLTFHPIDPDNTTKSSSPSEKRNHLSPANVRYRLSPTMNPSQSKPGGAKSAAGMLPLLPLRIQILLGCANSFDGYILLWCARILVAPCFLC